MPTPRHASLAAIDPVETVTPPIGNTETIGYLLDEPKVRLGASRAGWLVLHYPL